jgi:hypothetical protein
MTTRDESGTYLDGNALAGPLGAVFSIDITSVTAVCAGCGRSDRLATVHVYGAPMGLIARCAGCGEVMVRYAETSAGRALDLRGVSVLRLPAAGGPT